MNQFYPLDFFLVIKTLQDTETKLASTTPPNIPILKEHDDNLRNVIFLIKESFEPVLEIGSQDEVHRRASSLLSRLDGRSSHDGGNNNVAIQHDARVLRESIEHAYSERLFLCMPKEEARYYNQAALFSPKIASQFPEANKEITDAGNCYAVQLYTSCVFHLMRAVEHGARAMVSELRLVSKLKGKPIELCDWGELLRALEDKVLVLGSKKSRSTKAMGDYEFYSQAVAQFRHFRGGWRNNVSHLRKRYKAGETKDIMDNTKVFMSHLASGELEEKKPTKKL